MIATISLCALLVVILLSCVTRLNVGFVAIAFAWLVGLYAGVDANQVIAGFPSSLFLTLVGVTPKPANRFIAYNGAQPRWESRSIAKLTKMAVCAHKRFLHHIIDDGIITQYSACHGARAQRVHRHQRLEGAAIAIKCSSD